MRRSGSARRHLCPLLIYSAEMLSLRNYKHSVKTKCCQVWPKPKTQKCKCWTEGVMLLNTVKQPGYLGYRLCVHGSALRFLLSDTETERVSKAIQNCWYTICTRYRIIMTECLGYQNIFTLLRNRDYCKLLLICRSITPCMYIYMHLVHQPLCILKLKVIDVEKQS